MVDNFATAHAGAEKAEARVNDIFTIRQMTGEIVYALEKLGTKVQWPQKMKLDPSTKRSNVLCEFHQERGHKTEDCIGLRQEVVRMLNQGYLKELLSDKGWTNFARGCDQPQGPPKPPSPSRTIQIIIGGGDDTVINHVKFTTTYKLKRTVFHKRYDDLKDSIIFDKSDTDDLSFPHYDALVITLCIADTNLKRIMVDDGSGACIVHPRVLVQTKLEDKIIPHFTTLTGFNNAVERTSGEIVLPILVGGVTLEMTFHVMNQETGYNAIIGRPWIHAMRAVPSSFYQNRKRSALPRIPTSGSSIPMAPLTSQDRDWDSSSKSLQAKSDVRPQIWRPMARPPLRLPTGGEPGHWDFPNKRTETIEVPVGNSQTAARIR
uniref:Uncharacterized protein n=1 Tax=Nicotiana tabacum TaxID=4097 RepID=A0A1S4BBN2_TOBAC|nr:PREDICTED: uncharacterized protein LOC107806572 [Nicotiana tabacum]